MDTGEPAKTPAWFLGRELRKARLASGYASQEALAAKLGFDRSVINKAERGKRPPTPDVLAAWCAACNLDLDHYEGLAELARTSAGGAFPEWFEPWPDIEARAVRLHWFELTVIPGLLQTETYARSLLAGRLGFNGDLDEAVSARMERQSILHRGDPPELFAVIDEGVLHRPMGPPDVMAEQLAHLTEPPGRTTIRVIPRATGNHDGINGAFIIADLADGTSAAYLESGLRGMVMQNSQDVTDLAVTWDRLSTDALPRSASVALIQGVMETWKA